MEKDNFFAKRKKEKENKMLKEFLICIIIITGIVIGNIITQDYSVNSIEDVNNHLRELKEAMQNEEKNSDDIHLKVEKIDEEWEDMFSKLAYYIEHDELEKFAKNLENIKTYTELEDYESTRKEINEGIFILEHIEDKYSFNLQNIF